MQSFLVLSHYIATHFFTSSNQKLHRPSRRILSHYIFSLLQLDLAITPPNGFTANFGLLVHCVFPVMYGSLLRSRICEVRFHWTNCSMLAHLMRLDIIRKKFSSLDRTKLYHYYKLDFISQLRYHHSNKV
ncbi:unnamed protein product [Calicophoron daubneyi]|uniref:Uncharacterized protein n=1 Tax=Calicophoron daubneyi TaxID=300641 RepID=A0AAV2TZ69_CALDB